MFIGKVGTQSSPCPHLNRSFSARSCCTSPESAPVHIKFAKSKTRFILWLQCLIFTRELCSLTRFSLAEILELVGGAILPAAAVPASTRISARLNRVQGPSQFTRDYMSCTIVLARPSLRWLLRNLMHARRSPMTAMLPEGSRTSAKWLG